MGRGTRLRTSLTVLSIAAALMFIAFVPTGVNAFPYRVKGYVMEENGNPVTHATITIEGEAPGMASTYDDATDSSGYFDISFGVDEPGGLSSGETITLTATNGDVNASGELVLSGDRAWVNITVESDNDPTNFILSPLGMALIVIVVFVIIVGVYILVTGKKEKTSKEDERQNIGRRRR